MEKLQMKWINRKKRDLNIRGICVDQERVVVGNGNEDECVHLLSHWHHGNRFGIIQDGGKVMISSGPDFKVRNFDLFICKSQSVEYFRVARLANFRFAN